MPNEDFLSAARKAFEADHFGQVVNLLSHFNPEALDPSQITEALTMLGVSFLAAGDSKNALENIKKALSLNPHYPPALDAYGDILQTEGKFYAAIAKYRAAVKADPALWGPLYHWGYLLKRMGSHKAALRKFQAALDINPRHIETYLHAGDCAYQLEWYKRALDYYQAALDKGGESAEILTRIGNTRFITGDREKAVQAYEKSVKLDPMEGSSYENWGLVLHQEGKLEEARRKFEEGLLHAPQSATLLLRHAEILIALEKYREALAPLLKALELLREKMEGEWAVQWSSVLGDCAYMLGFVHRKLGDDSKAREYFLTALHYAPNHVDALGELAVVRGVYREHHVKWDFVLEGKVETRRGGKTGLRAYRVAALSLEEALRYAQECEEEIRGAVKAREVTRTEQVASYAGVLARGPLFVLGRASRQNF